jgi:hypothetical protein
MVYSIVIADYIDACHLLCDEEVQAALLDDLAYYLGRQWSRETVS